MKFVFGFLVGVLFWMWVSAGPGQAEADVWACYGSARYEAMSSAWTPCNEMSELCLRVRNYLQSHTADEARATARAKHIPEWIIRKAERCLR